jgi:hypothetical protein
MHVCATPRSAATRLREKNTKKKEKKILKEKKSQSRYITCQRVSAWQRSMGGIAFLWERVNFGPRQNKNHPTDQDQIWQA